MLQKDHQRHRFSFCVLFFRFLNKMRQHFGRHKVKRDENRGEAITMVEELKRSERNGKRTARGNAMRQINCNYVYCPLPICPNLFSRISLSVKC